MNISVLNDTYFEDPLGTTDWNLTANASADPLSAEWNLTLQEWRYIFQRILVPFVLIVGVVGNTITIVVLTRRSMQSSTNFYLTALAVSDLLYLVFVFSLSLQHIQGMNHNDMWLYWQYFRFALWFTDATSSTSTWLTVVFTVERYIAVCHPMKRKIFCTQTRAKRIIGAVYFLCFASTITTPFEWIIVANPKTNNTTLALDYSTLGSNDTYKKAFYWFTAVIFILIPLLFLTIFNSFLILAVKRSQVQRNQLTQRTKLSPSSASVTTVTLSAASNGDSHDSHDQLTPRDGVKKNSTGFQREKTLKGARDFHASQENKITRMLIAVVILALLCQSPTAIMLIYTSSYEIPTGTTTFYVTRILGNIFNFLATLNAACNFILYCAMSDRFRKTFLQTFCWKWHPQRSFRHYETEISAMEVSSMNQQHFSNSSSMVLPTGYSKSRCANSVTNEKLSHCDLKPSEGGNQTSDFALKTSDEETKGRSKLSTLDANLLLKD